MYFAEDRDLSRRQIKYLNMLFEYNCYASERKKPLIVKNAKETIRYDQLWVS